MHDLSSAERANSLNADLSNIYTVLTWGFFFNNGVFNLSSKWLEGTFKDQANHS